MKRQSSYGGESTRGAARSGSRGDSRRRSSGTSSSRRSSSSSRRRQGRDGSSSKGRTQRSRARVSSDEDSADLCLSGSDLDRRLDAALTDDEDTGASMTPRSRVRASQRAGLRRSMATEEQRYLDRLELLRSIRAARDEGDYSASLEQMEDDGLALDALSPEDYAAHRRNRKRTLQRQAREQKRREKRERRQKGSCAVCCSKLPNEFVPILVMELITLLTLFFGVTMPFMQLLSRPPTNTSKAKSLGYAMENLGTLFDCSENVIMLLLSCGVFGCSVLVFVILAVNGKRSFIGTCLLAKFVSGCLCSVALIYCFFAFDQGMTSLSGISNTYSAFVGTDKSTNAIAPLVALVLIQIAESAYLYWGMFLLHSEEEEALDAEIERLQLALKRGVANERKLADLEDQVDAMQRGSGQGIFSHNEDVGAFGGSDSGNSDFMGGFSDDTSVKTDRYYQGRKSSSKAGGKMGKKQKVYVFRPSHHMVSSSDDSDGGRHPRPFGGAGYPGRDAAQRHIDGSGSMVVRGEPMHAYEY